MKFTFQFIENQQKTIAIYLPNRFLKSRKNASQFAMKPFMLNLCMSKNQLKTQLIVNILVNVHLKKVRNAIVMIFHNFHDFSIIHIWELEALNYHYHYHYQIPNTTTKYHYQIPIIQNWELQTLNSGPAECAERLNIHTRQFTLATC